MKRERLEDLGRIYQLMYLILDADFSPLEECTSKHTYDSFLEKYKNNDEKLEDLHDWLRFHREKLEEIYYLAMGDIE